VLATLTVSFDPVLRLSDTASVRLETIALAVVLFVGLLVAARAASRAGLRIDDLVFIVVGAVPGAILGGRLGYILAHLAYYQANPNVMTDAAQGGLSLTLAVPFAIVTGGLIARLLGAPVSRWFQAAALPLLFVLGAGKLIGVLGATGQGTPSDVAWATAYLGPGPWGSLAPEVPSHPSQVYEAILVGVAVIGVALISRLEVMARREGAALFIALGLWAIARFVVGSTWRDPSTIEGLRTEQLLAVLVGVVAVAGFIWFSRKAPTAPSGAHVDVQPNAA
jgi:phosphatidylglycerol:prolipoprotein diacylglycerol transferase